MELVNSKLQKINFIQEKTMVIGVEIAETTYILKKITEQQQKL